MLQEIVDTRGEDQVQGVWPSQSALQAGEGHQIYFKDDEELVLLQSKTSEVQIWEELLLGAEEVQDECAADTQKQQESNGLGDTEWCCTALRYTKS